MRTLESLVKKELRGTKTDQLISEVVRLRQVVAKLTAENDRLRKTLKSQVRDAKRSSSKIKKTARALRESTKVHERDLARQRAIERAKKDGE